MKILITGCAGFLGFHLCKKILKIDKKSQIVGIDNLNNYYSVAYKKKRLSFFKNNKKFKFYKNPENSTLQNNAKNSNGAVQRCSNLVDLEECRKMRLLSLSEVSIQKRKGPDKFAGR